MDFILGFALLIVGGGAGYFVAKQYLMPIIFEHKRLKLLHLTYYLDVLNREIANHLMWQDPQRFRAYYKNMMAELVEFEEFFDDKRTKDALHDVVKMFPEINDFDVIGVKEFVLYDEPFSYDTIDKIYQNYRSIHIFKLNCQKELGKLPKLSNRISYFYIAQDDYIEKYTKRVIDTKDKIKIANIINIMKCLSYENKYQFENRSLKVGLAPTTEPGLSYAIQLKLVDEFYICEILYPESAKPIYRYYRSNSDFSEYIQLDSLDEVFAKYMETQAF